MWFMFLINSFNFTNFVSQGPNIKVEILDAFFLFMISIFVLSLKI